MEILNIMVKLFKLPRIRETIERGIGIASVVNDILELITNGVDQKKKWDRELKGD